MVPPSLAPRVFWSRPARASRRPPVATMIDIRVRAKGGAYVVSLSGVADAALLGMPLETVRQLAVEDGPVVVDLSDVTLIAPDAIRSMLESLSSVRELRVVSTRDTAREILRRCGLNRASLCKTVEEAVAIVGHATAFDERRRPLGWVQPFVG